MAGKSAVERRREIQNLLMGNSLLSVNELSAHFGVSAVTIRKDLRLMQEEGMVVRGHGVASQAVGGTRFSLSRDIGVRGELKQRIAREAEQLIRGREVILLGPGSTCCLLGQRLKKHKNLILVTNAISFEPYLADSEAQVVYLGGEYNPDNGSTVGAFAIDALNTLSIDRFFIGVTGITAEAGLTSYNFADTIMLRTMIERSRQVVVLTDHTKFGQVSAVRIAGVEAADLIITDNELDPAQAASFQGRDVKLVQV